MLLPLGLAALHGMIVLVPLLALVLVLLFVSYRQTIPAYPGGGGAYTVAKENLGARPSLVAAAALGLDYILNVAVAIAAGVGALASAIPALLPHTLPVCLGLLVMLTVVNLRGMRETGVAFMIPTYAFIFCLLAAIGLGVARMVTEGVHPQSRAPLPVPHAVSAASVWILVPARREVLDLAVAREHLHRDHMPAELPREAAQGRSAGRRAQRSMALARDPR